MAVERIPVESRLQGRYQVGTNLHGDPIFRTRILARVRPDGTDENMMATALAISGLQIHMLAEVRRADTVELVEVE